MTAKERYEQVWNRYLVLLNKNPKARLTPFLRTEHIYHRGMQQWMYLNGLSVQIAKQKIRMLQLEASEESRYPSSSSTGAMFLPVETSSCSHDDTSEMLSGISVTFPDGSQVSIKHGSAHAVMSFLKLYSREEALCLD